MSILDKGTNSINNALDLYKFYEKINREFPSFEYNEESFRKMSEVSLKVCELESEMSSLIFSLRVNKSENNQKIIKRLYEISMIDSFEYVDKMFKNSIELLKVTGDKNIDSLVLSLNSIFPGVIDEYLKESDGSDKLSKFLKVSRKSIEILSRELTEDEKNEIRVNNVNGKVPVISIEWI
jgi:hypothetical protein